MRNLILASLFLATSTSDVWANSAGSRLTTRAQLEAILGSTAVTEDFESYAISPNAFDGFSSPLDSTTAIRGQGPGLVIPGFRVRTEVGELQWYGTTVFGGNSKRLSFSSGQYMFVHFTRPVTAFGVDLLSLEGYSGRALIELFAPGPGDKLIGSFDSEVVNNAQTPTFVGYAEPAGIGIFTISTFVGGPTLDNLTFQGVPEPGGMALVLTPVAGLSMAFRRKRSAGVRP